MKSSQVPWQSFYISNIKESEKNENFPGLAQPLESPRPKVFIHLVTQQILLSSYDVPDTGILLWAKQILSPQPSRIHGLYLYRV